MAYLECDLFPCWPHFCFPQCQSWQNIRKLSAGRDGRPHVNKADLGLFFKITLDKPRGRQDVCETGGRTGGWPLDYPSVEWAVGYNGISCHWGILIPYWSLLQHLATLLPNRLLLDGSGEAVNESNIKSVPPRRKTEWILGQWLLSSPATGILRD